jgi:hypothetical protein
MKPCKFWNGNVKNFENKEELARGESKLIPMVETLMFRVFFFPMKHLFEFFLGVKISENNIINVKIKKENIFILRFFFSHKMVMFQILGTKNFQPHTTIFVKLIL